MGEVNKVAVAASEAGPNAPEKKTAAPLPAPQETKTPPAPTTPDPANATAPVKPEWCPDKFWKDGKVDQEGLAKSYAEIEKKQGAPAKDHNAPPAPETKIAGVGDEQLKKYTAELSKDGKLTPESYTELAKIGYSQPVVDAYIRGLSGEMRSGAEKIVAEVQNSVGGEQSYTDMVTWAASNLTPADQAAFNKAVTSGDEAQMRLAVTGLQARYNAANGVDGKLITGDGTGDGANGDVFGSAEEVRQAMSDPRYKRDEAYRKSVAEKLGRSKVM